MSEHAHFEVLPEMGIGGHETDVYTETRYHPSGDEYYVAHGECRKCEWTAHGEEEGVRNRASCHEETQGPTGRFVWRFRDANGDITFAGVAPFARREDAHRSIAGICADVLRLLDPSRDEENLAGMILRAAEYAREDGTSAPIVDLDEKGEVIPVG